MDINAPVVNISQFSPLDPNNSFNLAVRNDFTRMFI